MATLPPDLLQRVQNVAIVIERRPTARERKQAGIGPGHTLLGLYTGIPLTHRGHESYNLVLPDRPGLPNPVDNESAVAYRARAEETSRLKVQMSVTSTIFCGSPSTM